VLPLLDYGWTLLVQGQLNPAVRCLKAVVELAEHTAQPSIASTAYYQLAVAARLQGQWAASHQLNKQSLALHREIQGVAGELSSLWPRIGSAFLSLQQGRIDEAEGRLRRALTLLEQYPAFRNQRNSAQIGLGLVALERNDLYTAQSLLEGAMTDAVNLYPYTHVQGLLGLARLAQRCGESERAADWLRQALCFAGERSLLEEYIDTLLVIANLQPAGAPTRQLVRWMLDYVATLGLTVFQKQLGAVL
jgi:tetratricopeptide (TPR) repeat protein